MSGKNNYRSTRGGISVRRAVLTMAIVLAIGGVAVSAGRVSVAGTAIPFADRYYIRVDGCDDGGRAYVNGTQMVEVGFNETSDWLDVTEDLNQKDNKIKFEVVNKTGAITYIFQVRKNATVIYDQSCGVAAFYGCENNRAFRIGVAREFTFSLADSEW